MNFQNVVKRRYFQWFRMYFTIKDAHLSPANPEIKDIIASKIPMLSGIFTFACMINANQVISKHAKFPNPPFNFSIKTPIAKNAIIP